jgi:hypothetical protein
LSHSVCAELGTRRRGTAGIFTGRCDIGGMSEETVQIAFPELDVIEDDDLRAGVVSA